MLLEKLYSDDVEIWVFDDNLYLLKKYFDELEDLMNSEEFLLDQCKKMEFDVSDTKIFQVENPNYCISFDGNYTLSQPNGGRWIWLYEMHLEYCGE